MSTEESLISDKELEAAFKNTNFGSSAPRDIVKYALLKASCKYANGHTAQSILQELGLVGKSYMKAESLTKKGREYLWACFGKMGY
jgi:hypothetical protein